VLESTAALRLNAIINVIASAAFPSRTSLNFARDGGTSGVKGGKRAVGNPPK
jgi:hypothetical protein